MKQKTEVDEFRISNVVQKSLKGRHQFRSLNWWCYTCKWIGWRRTSLRTQSDQRMTVCPTLPLRLSFKCNISAVAVWLVPEFCNKAFCAVIAVFLNKRERLRFFSTIVHSLWLVDYPSGGLYFLRIVNLLVSSFWYRRLTTIQLQVWNYAGQIWLTLC